MALLDELSSQLEVGRGDLERFIWAAPIRYKVYDIPKRRGGFRTIAQPSATLKTIQRILLGKKLGVLPVHPAAAAYVIGKGISDNATLHAENKFILKLDFTSFFPSLRVPDWRSLVRRLKPEGIESADLPIYDKILFWGMGGIRPICLSIGAPTSPLLSNALLYRFDEKIAEATKKKSLLYTRYADDIVISGDSISSLKAIELFISNYVDALKSPKLVLNADKRGLYGPGRRKIVTGLINTPVGQVSIGRDRKRLISAMIHRATFGELDRVEMQKLRGLLSFCISAEPSVMVSFREKYGSEIIDRVLRDPLLMSK